MYHFSVFGIIQFFCDELGIAAGEYEPHDDYLVRLLIGKIIEDVSADRYFPDPGDGQEVVIYGSSHSGKTDQHTDLFLQLIYESRSRDRVRQLHRNIANTTP